MNIYENRIKETIVKMKENNLDAIILFPSPNLYYLTGFKTFPEGRLLLCVIPTNEKPFFIAPKLYESQIKKQSFIKEMVLWGDEENPYNILENVINERNFKYNNIAVDDIMWAEQLLKIVNIFNDANFTPIGNLLNNIRLLKSKDEIEKLQEASNIVDEVIEAVKASIKAGMTEIEIAALIEYEMRKRGSEGPSFETIVGSGPNSALPHYNAGERIVEDGDFVVLDFGGTYEGYCSDTTRTICIGKSSDKMKEVYNIVKEAQEIGVNTVKPGTKASEIDNAVRKHIEDNGYGKYFTHRTGHGIGLQVHEEPYISSISDTILKQGMVFSIEPGIYIDGEFGVRIEDLVVVTENGCMRLNNTSRELTII